MTLGFSLRLLLYSRSNQVPGNGLSIPTATKLQLPPSLSSFFPLLSFTPSVNEDWESVIEMQIDLLCRVQQQFVDTKTRGQKNCREVTTRRKGKCGEWWERERNEHRKKLKIKDRLYRYTDMGKRKGDLGLQFCYFTSPICYGKQQGQIQ